MKKFGWYWLNNVKKGQMPSNKFWADWFIFQILPTTHSDKFILTIKTSQSIFNNLLLCSTKDVRWLDTHNLELEIIQKHAEMSWMPQAAKSKTIIAEFMDSSVLNFPITHLRTLVHKDYQGMWIGTVLFNVSKNINGVFQKEISHTVSQLYFFLSRGYVPRKYYLPISKDTFDSFVLNEDEMVAFTSAIVHFARNSTLQQLPFFLELEYAWVDIWKKIRNMKIQDSPEWQDLIENVALLMKKPQK